MIALFLNSILNTFFSGRISLSTIWAWAESVYCIVLEKRPIKSNIQLIVGRVSRTAAPDGFLPVHNNTKLISIIDYLSEIIISEIIIKKFDSKSYNFDIL